MGEKAAKARKEKQKDRKRKPPKSKEPPEPDEHEIPEAPLYLLRKLQLRLKLAEKVFKEIQEMYNEEIQGFINTLNLVQNQKVDVDLQRGSVLVFHPPSAAPEGESEDA